jgi:hypothetical protein
MFLYEAIIGMVLLTMIITEVIQLLFTFHTIRQETNLSQRMHDILIANLILYENNQPFTISEDYFIEEREVSICIVYLDLKQLSRESCLDYEK